MSVKEIKSYAITSDIVINSLNTLSLIATDSTLTNINVNAIDASSITSLNATIETLTATGNTSLSNVTAQGLALNTYLPSFIDYKSTTTFTADITILTPTHIKGGLFIGNGAAAFKCVFDLAVNMYAALSMLNNQAIFILCVNKSAFTWIFDTADNTHILFNGGIASPTISAGTQKVMCVHFTGSPSVPTYDIVM